MKTCVAAVALALVSGSALAETIGGFTVAATPVSAVQLTPGGSLWGWLNVANAPVSINDAFSGSLLADDGYANGQTGVSVRANFAAGDLVNVPGPDFIFVDSRFSINSYNIFIDFDGYTVGQLAAGGAGTGESRDYFYGGSSGGPFRGELVVYPFDLSSWGVPLGGIVSGVQFVALSNEVDPIGFGSLVPAPGAIALFGLAGVAGRRRRS